MNILIVTPSSLSEIRGKKIRDKLVWNVVQFFAINKDYNYVSGKAIYRAILENIEFGYFVLPVLQVLWALKLSVEVKENLYEQGM
jgi:hypothetical protein